MEGKLATKFLIKTRKGKSKRGRKRKSEKMKNLLKTTVKRVMCC